MPKRFEIYKCMVCSAIVETLQGGQGELVCCGQPMKLFTENTVDASKEKHVPVIEISDNFVKVKIGNVPHPMEETHYIQWIELVADNKSYKQFLKPGDAPEAIFEISAKQVGAREFCNLHGLWRG